jgi:hypothetical protein
MRRVRQRQLRWEMDNRAHPIWRGIPLVRRGPYKPGRLHGGQVGVGGLAPRLQVGNWMRGWNRTKVTR